jgi:predicted Zn-dependent protease
MEDDCGAARERYTESIAQDPYYPTSYFERGEILKVCAARSDDEATKEEYLQEALVSLNEGLERDPDQVIRWLLLAEVHLGLGDTAAAVSAYEEATSRRTATVPQWQIDYTFARSLLEAGEMELAREYAELALAGAPPDAAAEIQRVIDEAAGSASSG